MIADIIFFRKFAPMKMNWQQLISNRRLGQEHKHLERHDDRTEFKRDYDRLIFRLLSVGCRIRRRYSPCLVVFLCITD